MTWRTDDFRRAYRRGIPAAPVQGPVAVPIEACVQHVVAEQPSMRGRRRCPRPAERYGGRGAYRGRGFPPRISRRLAQGDDPAGRSAGGEIEMVGDGVPGPSCLEIRKYCGRENPRMPPPSIERIRKSRSRGQSCGTRRPGIDAGRAGEDGLFVGHSELPLSWEASPPDQTPVSSQASNQNSHSPPRE